MALNSMNDLMLEELREIYSAERLALRAYPRFRKAVATPALREAIEQHMEQTKEQVERLGRVFELMDARARGKTCHAMEGLLEEAQAHLEADLTPELMEVMLVADLQKVEHLEIASYGSAKAHAEALGLTEAAQLLEETLNEEKETDALLNRLAIEEVNPKALPEATAEPDEGEEDAEEGEDGEEAEEAEGGEQPAPRSKSSKSGGASKGKARATSSPDDLKSREYTDKQGNVHHHTRSKAQAAN